jgi:ribosomal protein L37E
MVRRHIGPIGSLYDAWKAERDLWVLCQDCGHAAKLDTRKLILRLGDEASALAFDQLRLRNRLRCRRCGRWHVAFVPHYMPWSAMR